MSRNETPQHHTHSPTFYPHQRLNPSVRARVYQQWGDRKSQVQTAIETCPVDCIHYVGFEELQRLENEREGFKINYKARLVGSDALLSSSGSDLGEDWLMGQGLGWYLRLGFIECVDGVASARCGPCHPDNPGRIIDLRGEVLP